MTDNVNNQSTLILSLGQQLEQMRIQKDLSIEQVSGKLKFSIKQLTYLEQDKFDELLSPYLVRAMLRSYAKFLSVDEQPLILELERVLPAAKIQSFTKQEVAVQPKSVRFSMAKSPSNRFGFKAVLIGILLLVLLSLILWFQRNYLHLSGLHTAEKKESYNNSAIQTPPTVSLTPQNHEVTQDLVKPVDINTAPLAEPTQSNPLPNTNEKTNSLPGEAVSNHKTNQ
ncbi:MAG: hypothetical protein B7Z60_04520 [Ferrovum sp. 37-45-19]|nr:MAG: hypothetical protein B7Z65_02295 [Ferrovum sp. 21-44-67]OYV94451.1 MAG: hypothetical protein B7Z60_04520 [Ferrovum sp. 37-45-19]OZB32434.1 MAG: hypothetical protein B7X47_06285 [Ferrovum sp. 34-44-207]HQT81652.1 helix-turn-helix domain-containing protein [Ferrovaceae bacterium]HQU06541.1 helix-turn-helix domain-containing protein [Ferrovaceae bacterium]